MSLSRGVRDGGSKKHVNNSRLLTFMAMDIVRRGAYIFVIGELEPLTKSKKAKTGNYRRLSNPPSRKHRARTAHPAGRLLSGDRFNVGHGYLLGLATAQYLTWKGKLIDFFAREERGPWD
jgi:hypothetical protein